MAFSGKKSHDQLDCFVYTGSENALRNSIRVRLEPNANRTKEN
ncbi:hypothetical protein ACPOL_5560 [Acidisarcina polymorpha]|uniref:Uncharacterized protein n=1 Tax=Acidisarcina polymorpha TaxID=2211140 RepID=A0A2Z5G726_9BACT|nr:hypothetical protein ACPOL_5560 [Acidisarcina polymorpha]